MSVDDISSQPRWRRVDLFLLSCVVLVGLLARIPTMARPFQRDPEGCGAFYGTVARNYFRYGVIKTYAAPADRGCVWHLRMEPVERRRAA
jgi:hypothetical protein